MTRQYSETTTQLPDPSAAVAPLRGRRPFVVSAPSMPNELTARQLKIRVLALEYARDFNGARAAAAAGWDGHRAATTTSELLDGLGCQAELEKGMTQLSTRSSRRVRG